MTQDNFIQYGKANHAAEFQRLHPKAREVAHIASMLANILFKERFLTTTSIYRKKTTDSGIHEGYRAIDFKPMTNIADTYRLIEMVNSLFFYDPDRPNIKVAHTNPYHGTAPHIHIQVHDKTTSMPTHKTTQFLAQASKDQAAFKPLDLA